MKRNQGLLIACVLGLGLSAESMAGIIADGITADGKLNDWGLFANFTNQRTTWLPDGSNGGKTTQNGNTYYTASGNYTYGVYQIYYAIEDYTGGGDGWVNPGWGGQKYDAEALYVTWDAANLYIALVTGHDPNTKQNPREESFSAGDFALNFWNGADDKTYEFGIRTPHQKNNINDPSKPFTTSVYKTTNADWLTQTWVGSVGTAVTSLDMSQLTAQDRLGQASMSIKKSPNRIGPGSGSHWIYEISVAKDLFGDAFKNNSGLNVSWTMNCANDIITVEDDLPVTVDEPPVWAMLGLTLPVAFWRRRRSAKR